MVVAAKRRAQTNQRIFELSEAEVMGPDWGILAVLLDMGQNSGGRVRENDV
jgi:hypothetical protein